jgi:voltage-gated potassium channel
MCGAGTGSCGLGRESAAGISVENSPTNNDAVEHESLRRHAPYLLFILIVTALSIGVVAADEMVELDDETSHILRIADTLLCVIFFVDFLHCLASAENKRKYLMTWGLLDLISSIPLLGILRIGRAARVVRVLRLLRGIRSIRILLRFVLAKRT